MIEVGDHRPTGRIAALGDFLARWRGSLAMPPSLMPHEPGCPRILVEWLTLATSGGELCGAQNQFVAPALVADDPFLQWEPSGTRQVDVPPRLWTFYVENQGVVTWACEEGGPDPVVWARCDFAPSYRYAWTRETEPLSGVLIKAVLLESMFGAAWGGQPARMQRKTFERVKRSQGLVPIPLLPSRAPLQFWPDHYYKTDSFLVATYETGEPDDIAALFAARDEDALGFLHDEVDNPHEFGL